MSVTPAAKSPQTIMKMKQSGLHNSVDPSTCVCVCECACVREYACMCADYTYLYLLFNGI